MGLWLAAGFMETFFCVLAMIPYQEMMLDKEFMLFPLLFGFAGPFFYLRPYITFREGTESYSIYERIQFLPVDYGEIQKMRTIYLAKFVAKIFPIVFLLQMLFSYWFFKITIANVVYAVLIGLVWPFLSNLPAAWFSR